MKMMITFALVFASTAPALAETYNCSAKNIARLQKSVDAASAQMEKAQADATLARNEHDLDMTEFAQSEVEYIKQSTALSYEIKEATRLLESAIADFKANPTVENRAAVANNYYALSRIMITNGNSSVELTQLRLQMMQSLAKSRQNWSDKNAASSAAFDKYMEQNQKLIILQTVCGK